MKLFEQKQSYRRNSYERIFDALSKGPLTIQQMEDIVGSGYAARVSEFNRAYGHQFKVNRKHNVYTMERVCRIMIDRKKLAA